MKKFIVLIVLVIFSLSSAFAVIRPSEKKSSDRPTVAVVLSGGGAKGIAHIAMLEKIEELGIPVDAVLGTSMGSLIGGLYAAGYTPGEIRELIKNTDLPSLFTEIESSGYKKLAEPFDYSNPHLSMSLDGGIIGVGGLIDDYRIMNFFNEALANIPEGISFDDLHIPFRCVATNAITGKAKVFDSGSLIDAMRASMSIPFAFTPKEIDGEYYVDGGLVDNMPIDYAKSMGYDIIIAEDVNAQFAVTPESYKTISGSFDALFRVMINNTINDQKHNADVLLGPDLRGIGTLSFGNPDEIIKRGETEVILKEDELKEIAALFTEKQKEYLDAGRKGAYFVKYQEQDVTVLESSARTKSKSAYANNRISFSSVLPGAFVFKLDEKGDSSFVIDPTITLDYFLKSVRGSKIDMDFMLSVGKVISFRPSAQIRLSSNRKFNSFVLWGLDLNFGTQTAFTDRDNLITYNRPEAKLGGKVGFKFTDEQVSSINLLAMADYLYTRDGLLQESYEKYLNSGSDNGQLEFHYFYPRFEVSFVANDIFQRKIANSNGFRIDFQAVLGIVKEKMTYKSCFGIENEFFFKDEEHSVTLSFKAATSREPKMLKQSYYAYGGVDGMPGYAANACFSDFMRIGAVFHYPIKIAKVGAYIEVSAFGGLRSESSGYSNQTGDYYAFFEKNKIAESMSPFYECFGGRGEFDVGGSIAIGKDSSFGDFQIGFGMNNHLQASVFFNLR